MTTPTILESKKKEFDEKFPVEHYYCEDGWYSCPLAEDGCFNDDVEEGKCNCGAIELHENIWNWIITNFQPKE